MFFDANVTSYQLRWLQLSQYGHMVNWSSLVSVLCCRFHETLEIMAKLLDLQGLTVQCWHLFYFWLFVKACPSAPGKFVCDPAMAAIFSPQGEIEIFSNDAKCNQIILDSSPFRGEGRSIDLLDEELLILGDNSAGENGKFEYKEIHKPRKGLLGMRFSAKVLDQSDFGQGFNSPRWHTSYVFGNEFLALGGEFETGAQLLRGQWTSLSPSYPNKIVGACKVRLEKDTFLLIGGMSGVEKNTIQKLDILKGTVEELDPIIERRAFHSCEVFEGQVLITGGRRGNNTIADEIYNLNTSQSTILDFSSSLQRHKHQLLRLEDVIYSFGGLLSNGSQTSVVEWFDWNARVWRQHEHSLFSQHTSSLTVTPFPKSAVDCVDGCSCGKTKSSPNDTRIMNGQEAQVF